LHCPYPTSEREIAPQTDAPNRKEGTKRKLSELLETRDQRRERKRLKREKKEKRAAKRAAKAKRTMKQLKANSLDTAERQKPPVDVIFTSIDQSGSQGHCERSVYTSPQVDDSATKDNKDPKKRKKKREKKDP
jgi:hypothetical protein